MPRQNLVSSFEKKIKTISYSHKNLNNQRTMNNAISKFDQTVSKYKDNPDVDVDHHATNFNITNDYEKIFTSTHISLSDNDYSPSIQTNISNKTPSDKDDYPQINKQESNPVIDQVNEINDNIKRIRDKLNDIHYLTLEKYIFIFNKQNDLINIIQRIQNKNISFVHLCNILMNRFKKILFKINKQKLKYLLNIPSFRYDFKVLFQY